jgi:glycosyltransferase involved in cell wall biosynthesis
VAKVSILMNCFNGEKYLRESIDSVLNQTFEDWEIIFWDNQSTDGSAQIVASYNDSRIKYYYAPTHTTLYAGRNAAFKYCTGDYLAFLDCDDLWVAEKLEKQVSVFEQNHNVVLVYSNTIFFNSDLGTEKILNKHPQPEGSIFRECIGNYNFSLETVMVRMKSITDNGIEFCKKFNMIGDRDFLTAVCFYGDAHYIHEVLGKWRIHASNYSKELEADYAGELKTMYLRFNEMFGDRFTREMRVEVYNEIVFREAVVLLKISGARVRQKLRKIHFLNTKGFVLRILSYFPKHVTISILNLLKRA